MENIDPFFDFRNLQKGGFDGIWTIAMFQAVVSLLLILECNHLWSNCTSQFDASTTPLESAPFRRIRRSKCRRGGLLRDLQMFLLWLACIVCYILLLSLPKRMCDLGNCDLEPTILNCFLCGEVPEMEDISTYNFMCNILHNPCRVIVIWIQWRLDLVHNPHLLAHLLPFLVGKMCLCFWSSRFAHSRNNMKSWFVFLVINLFLFFILNGLLSYYHAIRRVIIYIERLYTSPSTQTKPMGEPFSQLHSIKKKEAVLKISPPHHTSNIAPLHAWRNIVGELSWQGNNS